MLENTPCKYHAYRGREESGIQVATGVGVVLTNRFVVRSSWRVAHMPASRSIVLIKDETFLYLRLGGQWTVYI